MPNKICPKCKIDKDFSQFHACHKRLDGKQTYCIDCRRPVTRAYIKKLYRTNANYRQQQKEYKKAYLQKPETKAMLREYFRKARLDPMFRLANCLRSRMAQALRGQNKSQNTVELMGCSVEELREHLKKQFKSGMTWDNYGKGAGKWSIDHIRPCDSFDLSSPEQQRQCFHYSNLQPLWCEENSRKHNHFNES